MSSSRWRCARSHPGLPNQGAVHVPAAGWRLRFLHTCFAAADLFRERQYEIPMTASAAFVQDAMNAKARRNRNRISARAKREIADFGRERYQVGCDNRKPPCTCCHQVTYAK